MPDGHVWDQSTITCDVQTLLKVTKANVCRKRAKGKSTLAKRNAMAKTTAACGKKAHLATECKIAVDWCGACAVR